MDIQLPKQFTSPQLLAASKTPILDLKLNQQLEAKFVSANVITNSIALAIGEQTLQLQANQALPATAQLPPGTTLTLQVVRLTPQPEFKLLTPINNLPSTSLNESSAPAAIYQPASPNLLNTPASATTANATVNLANFESSSSAHNALSPPLVPAPTNSSPLPTAPLAPPLHFKLLPPAAHQTSQPPESTTQHTDPGQALSKPVSTTLPQSIPNTPTASNTSADPTQRLNPTPQATEIPTQVISAKVISINSTHVQLQILASPSPNIASAPVNSAQTNPTPTLQQPASATTDAMIAQAPKLAPSIVVPAQSATPKPQLPPGTPPGINVSPSPSSPSATVITIPLKTLQTAPPGSLLNDPKIAQLLASTSQTPTPPAAQLKIGETIQIAVLPNQSPPKSERVQTAQHIHSALLEQLPKQSSPIHVLQHLQAALPSMQHTSNVPETLKTLAQKILLTLPTATSISQPDVLETSLSNSGIFMESKLAQSEIFPQPDLAQDFKANLLKLHTEVKASTAAMPTDPQPTTDLAQSLPEIQQKTEQALAKLALDQLASLPKDDSVKQTWHLEIPYMHSGQLANLNLSIEHEPPHAHTPHTPEAAQNWSVLLSISPPGLGAIHCKIIFAQGLVNTYFRSEHNATTAQIKAHIEHLRAQLEAQGLTPGHLDAHSGQFQQNLQDKLQTPNLFYAKV